MFKNTEFYGGGETSENSLNEPAELSLRCLAKTENDHCAAPCDTGVRDVGVPVGGIGYQIAPATVTVSQWMLKVGALRNSFTYYVV